MHYEAIDARRLAQRLLPVLDTPALDPASPQPGGYLAAAVLVPMIDAPQGAHLLFIHRAEDLPDHSGQVSYPGGIREARDADLYATALRESAEEVGVRPGSVRALGALASVTTLEKYLIQPYLSLWPDADYQPASPREVLRVFRVPLAWLLDPASETQASVSAGGRRLVVPAWEYDGEVIWGATRRITLDLLARIRRVL